MSAAPSNTTRPRKVTTATLQALRARGERAVFVTAYDYPTAVFADRAGVDLSDWEGEFLGSVSQRVKTYGRAFADPDKGASGGTLSLRQGVKLKEIRRKAKIAKPAQDDGDA